ncbi:MAG: hypothetical protein WA173_17130 [Pseudomonas sp.]|uniref:hypothetical protein n=1 Tax=Pseudomonas sp. TaxID=306 RepID=UPI003BB79DF9
MVNVTLGGLPIVLHAGAPDQSDSPLLGEAVVRMSEGAGVKMSHWSKAAGSISLAGWMPPGLDGLDYSQPLVLCLTAQECMVDVGLVFALTSMPRPDVAPWAQALIGSDWVRAACAYAAGVATVTSVAGATLYMVQWMPTYNVFASKPPKSTSTSTGSFGSEIVWEEV